MPLSVVYTDLALEAWERMIFGGLQIPRASYYLNPLKEPYLPECSHPMDTNWTIPCAMILHFEKPITFQTLYQV